MSLWGATSLDVIDVQEIISIKSTNLNETEEGRKDSASFFHRYMVHKAAYVTYGSIYCQLAEKNNFTEEDAEKIHQALITLFEGGAAAMRPAGTMFKKYIGGNIIARRDNILKLKFLKHLIFSHKKNIHFLL